ncbi:hypothetical protein RHMOL_Rhmol06G0185800 [Rhododendron molle]|uniref:Uncharacterized protein n=1 Tax=Rhododendron molle TaxID=49168 RepID=A0ACC0NE03_RHOML|nr:hypothetical protein RHMOL_Rhmol06G0185800 [Rhododendron molle]
MAATNQNAPSNTPPNNAPKISPMEDAVKKIIEEHVAPLKAEVDLLKMEIKALMDAHREELLRKEEEEEELLRKEEEDEDAQ